MKIDNLGRAELRRILDKMGGSKAARARARAAGLGKPVERSTPLSAAEWEQIDKERKLLYPKRRKKLCACGCGREVHSRRAGVWRLYATTACAVTVSNKEKKKKKAGFCTDCGERLFAESAARCKECGGTIGKREGRECGKGDCTNRIAMCSGRAGRPPVFCSIRCKNKAAFKNNKKNLALFKREVFGGR